MPAETDRMRCAPRMAHWHPHINHVQAPARLWPWLTDQGSLTARLIAHSHRFQVQKISQQTGLCWQDEFQAVGLPKRAIVHGREVLLRCDGQAAIYAHTVMPLYANASQWPLFHTLGNRSLGSTLFSDPQVRRGALAFARLAPSHPAMRRARLLTGLNDCGTRHLFARRSLFYRRGAVLLVTELFLPAVWALQPVTVLQVNNECNVKLL